MALDTVFNNNMRPVFVEEPETVRRRLTTYPYPTDWVKVCIGETGQIVTIAEYLYLEKYKDVLDMIKELLQKQGLSLYQRDPSRFDRYVERTARKIIERVLSE